MSAEQRVWKVCDAIAAKGEETVTVQTAIDAMMARAPYRAMARGAVMLHVRNWKVAREYKPRLEVRILPGALQEGLTGFAKTVWEAAMIEATARLDDQRKLTEAERLATDDLLREAGAKLDRDGETGRLRQAEVERLKEDNAAVRAEVERLRRRLDHVRAEEFWDRVMREIHAIIPARGEMTPEEILPRLRQSTLRGARLHREPISAETLAKKMDVRVSFGKFFVKGEGRTYRREPRRAAATAHGET